MAFVRANRQYMPGLGDMQTDALALLLKAKEALASATPAAADAVTQDGMYKACAVFQMGQMPYYKGKYYDFFGPECTNARDRQKQLDAAKKASDERVRTVKLQEDVRRAETLKREAIVAAERAEVANANQRAQTEVAQSGGGVGRTSSGLTVDTSGNYVPVAATGGGLPKWLIPAGIAAAIGFAVLRKKGAI
jgi:hypothetical protein